MSVWESYPQDYRSQQVQTILRACRAGECVSVVGLSGSGKSNLLGFLAHHWPLPGEVDDIDFILIDCNRLSRIEPGHVFDEIGALIPGQDRSGTLIEKVGAYLKETHKVVCLMFDRFEIIQQQEDQLFYNRLRTMRDTYKYRLIYLLAGRQPLADDNELAELFYAHRIWLGPLTVDDTAWNVARYAERLGEDWDSHISGKLYDLSWGYPSMLRGLCEAYSDIHSLEEEALLAHPAVTRRVREFWKDAPDEQALSLSGLTGHPMLTAHRPVAFNAAELTAKEHALLNYLLAHQNELCEKDALIRAVWPEDEIYEDGIRDESLSQLVRRLRKKIEPDPSNPRYLHTIPGRGFRFEN